MDGFKNPETYQKLKALGIVDINPTEFSGDELSHHLSHCLFNYEFTADDLDNPLEQERRLHLQDAVNTAVVIAATHGRYDDKTRTEMEFSRIRSLSSLLLSSTRLKDMEASKAKAYREGHGSHEKHFSDTLRNVKLQSKPSSTEPIPYSYEGGPVYYVCSPDHPCHDYPLLDTDLPSGLWTRVVILRTAGGLCPVGWGEQNHRGNAPGRLRCLRQGNLPPWKPRAQWML